MFQRVFIKIVLSFLSILIFLWGSVTAMALSAEKSGEPIFSGTVRNGSTPVSGAVVSLDLAWASASNPWARHNATTDAQGRYSFDNSLLNGYSNFAKIELLSWNNGGIVYYPETYPGAPIPSQPTIFDFNRQPETVTLDFLNPANGSTISVEPGNPIILSVTAEPFPVNSTTITSVIFSINGQEYPANNTAGNIYEFAWTPTLSLYYSNILVTATATASNSSQGNHSTSFFLDCVGNNCPNQPPVITWITPEETTLIQPDGLQSITIVVNAADNDGTITGVEINIVGTIYQMYQDPTPDNYSFVFTPSEYQSYPLTVTAIDNDGGTSTISKTLEVLNSKFVPLPTGNIILGYKHGWFSQNSGYVFYNELVDKKFNVVAHSFILTENNDGFTPYLAIPKSLYQSDGAYNEQLFIDDINSLRQAGIPVIVSVGGGTGYISLSTVEQKDIFVEGIKEIVDRYNFDGLDINFEGASMHFEAGSLTSFSYESISAFPKLKHVVDAFKELKQHYGNGFILTTAPETHYVQRGFKNYDDVRGSFLPIIHNLRNELDLLMVQLYNTGSMYALDNQIYYQSTKDFIPAMTEMLITGFNVAQTGIFFPGLPQSKICVALPACPSSGPAGGYLQPDETIKALDYLRFGTHYEGRNYNLIGGPYPNLRGMMTWSVEWDALETCASEYEFSNSYHDYFFPQSPSPVYYLVGSSDDASNYATWINENNEGYGFAPWQLSSGGNAGFFLGDPLAAGISGMSSHSFGLFANPADPINYANADRYFVSELGIGSTFSVDWGVNWDSAGSGSKGINLYTGGISGTQVININMGGGSNITINGNQMFSNYGNQAINFNFKYQEQGQLRVFATGRDGIEIFDEIFSVAGAPDAVRFYASGLAAGDQRQPYFNNLRIETDASFIPSNALVKVKGKPLLEQNLDVEHLTVEIANILEIAPNVNVTVNGDLVNHSGVSGIILKSDPSGTASLINFSSGVEVTVERFIPESNWSENTGGWHLLSAPVYGQSIENSWTPTGVGNDYDFYVWTDQNIPLPWLNQKNPVNDAIFKPGFIPGKGYLVSYEKSETKLFEGILNNGNIPIGLTYSAGSSWAGWNLLGNPYPSAIDWSQANTQQFQDNFAYVYDRNKEGGSGYVAIGGGGPYGNQIAAHQGFFALANSQQHGQGFSFQNDWRVHGDNWRKSHNESNCFLILKLSRGQYYDETFIRLFANSEFDRDRNDAIKIFSFNNRIPEIFTLSDDNIRLSINSIPNLNANQGIGIGLLAYEASNYSLSISNVGASFEPTPFFLYDLSTSSIYDMRQIQNLHFFSDAGEFNERFRLYFDYPTFMQNLSQDPVFEVFWSSNVINLILPQDLENSVVHIFDMGGRLIISKEVNGGGRHSIPANIAPGVYVVRFMGKSTMKSTKIIVD